MPLSFSDIVIQLDIRKGSVSQGLQFLHELGPINIANTLVRKDEASHREYFESELCLKKLMGGILHERLSSMTTDGENRISRLRKLSKSGGRENDFQPDRVKQLEIWRKRLKTILPMLAVLLGPKTER